MSESNSNNQKKRKIKGELDTKVRNRLMIQDLANGASHTAVLKKYGIDSGYLSRLAGKPANKKIIEEGHAKIVRQRQEKWDQFIEEEEDTLLYICKESSVILKGEIEKIKKGLKSGDEFEKREIRLRDGDRHITLGPRMTLQVALSLYKEARSIFAMLQRDAADDLTNRS